jgi:hypothetical protein
MKPKPTWFWLFVLNILKDKCCSRCKAYSRFNINLSAKIAFVKLTNINVNYFHINNNKYPDPLIKQNESIRLGL